MGGNECVGDALHEIDEHEGLHRAEDRAYGRHQHGVGFGSAKRCAAFAVPL